MSYDRIVISSGHGKYVRGAAGNPGLDEVDEARKVTEYVADSLRSRGVWVKTFHDDVSKSQSENLSRIVDFHNAQARDLDVSIHFNAYKQTASPMGTEVLYLSQKALATEVSAAIADAGFIDRGPKKRTDLAFLNGTSAPAILIEVCFVDSSEDCGIYISHFDLVCENIASVLGGIIEDDGIIGDEEMPEVPSKPSTDVMSGTCSYFGGPDDMGVSASEGLAFIYDINEDNQWLFLPTQPPGTTGLARRLNTEVHYCAMRWDYAVHPKNTLLLKRALVRNPKTGFAVQCTPADWGPHEEKTGRLIDLSPSMMRDLGLSTDDLVEVVFPYQEEA